MKHELLRKQTGEEKYYSAFDQTTGLYCVFERVKGPAVRVFDENLNEGKGGHKLEFPTVGKIVQSFETEKASEDACKKALKDEQGFLAKLVG